MKAFSLKRFTALFICLGAVILTLGGFGVTSAIRTAANNRVLPIYSVKRDDNKVAISFDAAWGNEDTDELIDILAQYNVKTTFFVVGQWVDKYPESVLALFTAGHEIMNHSNTHPHMTQLSKEGILSELNACSDKIEAITNVRPTLLRPPYGDYNNTLITTLTEQGVYSIQWDVDSLDWKGISAAEITKRVLSKIESGSIVLFHNAAEHTPEALPEILKGIKEMGYEIVPVSEIIYYEDYTIDHAGEQILNTPV